MTRERNRAERALTDLKNTAPTLAEYARALVDEQRFDDALNSIRAARELDPPNPDYAVQQGHILETLQRYPEAAEAYRAALQARPEDAAAQTNLALATSLETERTAEKEGSKTALAHLHTELVRQQRTAESVWVLKQLVGDAQRNYDTWKPVVEKLGVRIIISTYRANKDDTLVVNCNRDANILDLSSLAGMPISDLNIDKTSVHDLRPLRGMPLSRLVASNLPELSDIAPLRGMPLRALSLNGTNVSDLSPLRGMALVEFRVDWIGGSIADYSPLEGMPLEILELSRTKIFDPRILAPMPLRDFRLSSEPLSDFSFLRGKALTRLRLTNCPVKDLSVLAGMPLQTLQLTRCQMLEDLSPLRNLPLQTLDLWESSVSDLSPLAGVPLRNLNLRGCGKVKEVKLLASISTLEEVTLPPEASPEPLRTLPNLKRLSYRTTYDSVLVRDRPAQTAAEFWAEYEAQHAAGKK